MKKVIKCIITDYGRVISNEHDAKYIEKMAGVFNLEINAFKEIYTSKRDNYDRGTISAEEYWKSIAEITETEINNKIISKLIKYDIKSWTNLNKKMLDYIKQSRKQTHKLAILSNMSFDTKNYILKNYIWLNKFDEKIFSCDIKHNKPEKEIYEHCLETIGIAAEESLFIDDSEKNIAGAEKLGINTILFTDFESFYQEINKKYTFSLS